VSSPRRGDEFGRRLEGLVTMKQQTFFSKWASASRGLGGGLAVDERDLRCCRGSGCGRVDVLVHAGQGETGLLNRGFSMSRSSPSPRHELEVQLGEDLEECLTEILGWIFLAGEGLHPSPGVPHEADPSAVTEEDGRLPSPRGRAEQRRLVLSRRNSASWSVRALVEEVRSAPERGAQGHAWPGPRLSPLPIPSSAGASGGGRHPC